MKEIFAEYNNKTIRVYQGFNCNIAREAINKGTFGDSFNLNRMTWVKPSFLWMMYRSNWASKKDQEHILAIDIIREGFDEILSKAVLTTDESSKFNNFSDWKNSIKSSEVYCQWDPDRDIWGKPIGRRAIQLGIKGQVVKEYITNWIYKITDITPEVIKWRNQKNNGCLKKEVLPKEIIYKVEKEIRISLGMD